MDFSSDVSILKSGQEAHAYHSNRSFRCLIVLNGQITEVRLRAEASFNRFSEKWLKSSVTLHFCLGRNPIVEKTSAKGQNLWPVMP